MTKAKRYSWLLLLPVLLMLIGCQKKQTDSNNQINIITSTPTYAEMARNIGGKYADVQSVIKSSNTHPHDFEPSTENAKQASKADIAIYNGLGYDDWMSKLLDNNTKATKFNVGKIMHKKSTDNPHIWYEPKALETVAKKLADDLSAKHPSKRDYFQKNYKKYVQSMEPLQEDLDHIKSHRRNNVVAVSEPVFDYSLAAMGYKIANPQFAKAVESGSDPAPKDVEQLHNLITHQKIDFLVVNEQASTPLIKNIEKLAKKHEVPIIKVTETQPIGKTYQEWMQSQYKEVLEVGHGH